MKKMGAVILDILSVMARNESRSRRIQKALCLQEGPRRCGMRGPIPPMSDASFDACWSTGCVDDYRLGVVWPEPLGRRIEGDEWIPGTQDTIPQQ